MTLGVNSISKTESYNRAEKLLTVSKRLDCSVMCVLTNGFDSRRAWGMFISHAQTVSGVKLSSFLILVNPSLGQIGHNVGGSGVGLGVVPMKT